MHALLLLSALAMAQPACSVTVEFAVAAHHDENGNNKLDTRWLVIPNEPLGMSNNAKGGMGPPSYSDAAFILSTDTTLNINMLRI